MKPKKTEHKSATGKTMFGTDAEFYLASRLPFSRVTLADRREILFNFFGEPLMQRGPGLPPAEMDPRDRVVAKDILWTDRIYADEHRHYEKRELAKRWVEEFQNGLPISTPPQIGERKQAARA